MPEPSVSPIAIYQLRVVLRGVSPLIWRRLLVVSETSLGELHEILQSALGWSGEHSTPLPYTWRGLWDSACGRHRLPGGCSRGAPFPFPSALQRALVLRI